MGDIRVVVESYAGLKAEESPRAFFVDGKKITVLKVLRMWVEEGEQNRKRKRFYVAEGNDGFVHRLYYDMEIDGWFYRGVEHPV